MAPEDGKDGNGERRGEEGAPSGTDFVVEHRIGGESKNSTIAIVRVNARVADVRRALRPRRKTWFPLQFNLSDDFRKIRPVFANRRKRDCRVHTNVKRRARLRERIPSPRSL